MMTRRHILKAALTSAAAAVLAACTRKAKPGAAATTTPGAGNTATTTPGPGASSTRPVPSCVVKPSLTEGPYFVDERLNRSDIREDRDGVPLRLTFNVGRVGGSSCVPIAGALVDVWHCDAAGVYSDVSQQNTVGKKFCRGYQTTDDEGVAGFTTIFPGWYTGRAIHIHFKIRSGSKEFTSQLFFDDATIAAVVARAPYSSKGSPDTSNAADGIYGQSGGQLTLALATEGSGYVGTFDIGLQV